MAYHDGELSAAGSRKIEKHLAVCTECAQLMERLVRADQAAGTAGVPDVPGPDDRYWESFTSRVLDRVEEDAATRVPVSEKKSRSLIPMAFPRMAPAVSIALVVVVSAGVLIKINRVAPVPKAPLTRAEGVEDQDGSTDANRLRQGFDGQEAMVDKGRGAKVVKEQGERQKAKDDVGGLFGQKQESLRQEALDESAAALKEVQRDEPEKKGAAPAQRKLTVPELETGKLTSSSAEVASVPAAHAEAPPPVARIPEPEVMSEPKATPSPLTSPEPMVNSATKTTVSLKTAAMADEASVESDQNNESMPSSPAVIEPELDALARKSASLGDLDTVGGSALEAAGDVQAPEIQTYVLEEERAAKPVEAPSSALSPDTGDTFEAALPGFSETLTEVRKTSGVPSSRYREPREQLEHSRRLAEVRKYWESEQILKDLISQKPPSPVYEEASILMVEVLKNQNRVLEAQQFLDEAKQQFPANDMVQQFRLETPVPVQ
jgi:hypothetical protein